MTAALMVFLGGGAGSLLRWIAGRWAAQWFGPFTAGSGWPWGTFLVNLAGCCIMGLCYRLLPPAMEGDVDLRLLLMTGVLGGFTTYSAFALDSALLAGRGDTLALSLYVGGTVAGALGGVALGLALGRLVSA
jgi:CrcB protein